VGGVLTPPPNPLFGTPLVQNTFANCRSGSEVQCPIWTRTIRSWVRDSTTVLNFFLHFSKFLRRYRLCCLFSKTRSILYPFSNYSFNTNNFNNFINMLPDKWIFMSMQEPANRYRLGLKSGVRIGTMLPGTTDFLSRGGSASTACDCVGLTSRTSPIAGNLHDSRVRLPARRLRFGVRYRSSVARGILSGSSCYDWAGWR